MSQLSILYASLFPTHAHVNVSEGVVSACLVGGGGARCFGVCEWTGTTRESCNAIGIPCFLRGTVRVAGRCGCFEATHGMQSYVSAHSLIFANCSCGHSKCQLPWHYVSGLPACMIGDSVRWYPPAPLPGLCVPFGFPVCVPCVFPPASSSCLPHNGEHRGDC